MRLLGPFRTVATEFVLIAAALLGQACSSPSPNISASEFNQSCVQATDCVQIGTGAGCCPGCGDAAINKLDLSKYQAMDAQRQAACTGTLCDPGPCLYMGVACTAGRCVACPIQGCSASGGQDAGTD
jgi:hypothetical protein